MNLLEFLAIVITVTGLLWLLQLLVKGKKQIDINVSVGRRPSSAPTNSVVTFSKTGHGTTDPASADSIMGAVLQAVTRSTEVRQKNVTVSQPPSQDAHTDTALNDATFMNLTDVTLLEDVNQDQLPPQFGRLTYSCFGNVAEQMPPGSFDKPQSTQHIEAMFALLRESTQRIEQQMIALNAVQRSLFNLATEQREKPGMGSADDNSQPGENRQSESAEYNFSDDERSEESPLEDGSDAQVATMYFEGESQLAWTTEFISASEAGMDMPEDAFQSFDLDEISEPISEIRQPIFTYLTGLNQTGELSHEVVAAIKRKAPAGEVKHRVRQVLRAIDHYNFSSDANALLRITAVFQNLPRDLKNYDQDVASIGRKFGLLEPNDDIHEFEGD